MLSAVGDTVKLVSAGGSAVTVVCADADCPPLVVAVMVAFPAPTATTRQALPATVAVAILACDDVQLASVGVGLPPVICTLSVPDSPTLSDSAVGDRLTTTGGGATTVIATLDVSVAALVPVPEPLAVTEMTADPCATAVTTPVDDTLAVLGALDK